MYFRTIHVPFRNIVSSKCHFSKTDSKDAKSKYSNFQNLEFESFDINSKLDSAPDCLTVNYVKEKKKKGIMKLKQVTFKFLMLNDQTLDLKTKLLIRKPNS